MATEVVQITELLTLTSRGDRHAFEQLYRATSAKLYGVILRILKRRDLADEVMQDVYARIWERAGDFDPARASPITWMATIARNRALDVIRRVQPVSIEDNPQVNELPSDDIHALDGMIAADEVARLKACIDGLDRDRRDIVLLAYREGLSREAIAERYARPIATIKTWLHRSLAQLKKCLTT